MKVTSHIKTEKVERIVVEEVPVEQIITLELNETEASMLMLLVGNISCRQALEMMEVNAKQHKNHFESKRIKIPSKTDFDNNCSFTYAIYSQLFDLLSSK